MATSACFSSAPARDYVHSPHCTPQARTDCLQQLVAGAVAEAVVDQLEVVQVDEEDAYALRSAVGPFQTELEMLEERGPIGQAGQGVMQRCVCELLPRLGLHTLALADIGNHPADE